MKSNFNQNWTKAIILNIQGKNCFEAKSAMNYPQAFVFELVGMRLGLDKPLECSTNDYEFTAPCVVPMYEKGATKHYPELEKIAFDVTNELLPVILKAVNETDTLIGLSKYIEDCV